MSERIQPIINVSIHDTFFEALRLYGCKMDTYNSQNPMLKLWVGEYILVSSKDNPTYCLKVYVTNNYTFSRSHYGSKPHTYTPCSILLIVEDF